MRVDGERVTPYRQGDVYTGYAGAVICALVLVAVWVMALPRVPAGWPVIAVDGAGYLLSIIVIAGGYDRLKRAIEPFPAFLVAAGTWAFIVFAFRSILVGLTGD